MSLSAPAAPESTMAMLRYFDVIVVVVAAPVLLLIGVPALGYGVGAGAWIVLRALGAGVERVASASDRPGRELNLRLAYMLSRLFLLALAVIIVRKQAGQDDSVAALGVIIFAFTAQLTLSFANRPRSR
jgi:hypothetical protein